MNKKIYNLILAVVCLLFCSSCNDFLDIKPKGIVIPEKCYDYEKLLNASEINKASEYYPGYLTDDAYLPDTDDDMGISFDMAERHVQNLYTYQPIIFGESEDDGLWKYSYNHIYVYNTIIDNVMSSIDATEDYKKSIRAEALMGRAFEYLGLVNAYAKHYDKATATTDLGVPLTLDGNINKTLQRATVQEVYDQIKKDLDEAAIDLPDRPRLNVFRASKPVGYGMLARMYLYMGNYEKALENAKISLEYKSTLLNKQNYTVDFENWIYCSDLPYGADNPENIYVRFLPYIFGLNGSLYISQELSDLFDKENDMRYKLSCTEYLSGTDLPLPIWLPGYPVNVAMSTPEMYLIAAECEARIGTVDKAMHYIDQLRDARIIHNTHLEGVVTNKDEALKIVLDERRKELAMTGCFRIIDLKRLNKEPRFAKTIVHTINGVDYKLEPNSPRYVFPIPLNVLQFNPDMPQNER